MHTITYNKAPKINETTTIEKSTFTARYFYTALSVTDRPDRSKTNDRGNWNNTINKFIYV